MEWQLPRQKQFLLFHANWRKASSSDEFNPRFSRIWRTVFQRGKLLWKTNDRKYIILSSSTVPWPVSRIIAAPIVKLKSKSRSGLFRRTIYRNNQSRMLPVHSPGLSPWTGKRWNIIVATLDLYSFAIFPASEFRCCSIRTRYTRGTEARKTNAWHYKRMFRFSWRVYETSTSIEIV